MNRDALQTCIEETYGTIGERLFAKDPATCVFRHKHNRKWFAIIMEIPRARLGLQEAGNICVVNCKCDVRLIGSFRLEPGIYPDYPQGSRDDTHTQAAGARLFARIAAEMLKAQGLM